MCVSQVDIHVCIYACAYISWKPRGVTLNPAEK